MSIFENSRTVTKNWKSNKISIVYRFLDFPTIETKQKFTNDASCVRLHFNLQGSYNIYYSQLNKSYYISGQHNNIAFLNGYEVEVENKTNQIEVLGIQFDTSTFIDIAQNGNDPLKKLVDNISKHQNAILSEQWRPNNFNIQQVINEILNCQYTGSLQDIFLLSKSIELLVLQADLYEQQSLTKYIKSNRDKQKLLEAREVLDLRTINPPTIRELSKLVGINEYKLKKGFKEIFGVTVFGYIHKNRMIMAKQMLQDSDESAKEIAYKIGYSSPQHFSKAFKNEFGVTPNSIRNIKTKIIIPGRLVDN